MLNYKTSSVGTNITEKATLIWNVADMLRGPFKPHEYGLVILPMTVVKRFHDCLLPTWQTVQDTYEKIKHLQVVDGFLTRAAGYQFYNISKFTFDKLLADPENIEANFRDYLAGFSGNVQDVLSKFDFDNVIKRMVESNTLYLTIKEFNSPKGYLGPDKVSAVDCGYIFEDLVRRFSESFGEEAGAHFTSRDIIYLMTDLLLSGVNLTYGGNVTVYDMTMGTSQMLSCMEERIHELDPDTDVVFFGQEFNPSTFAIAKADMMIRGGNPDNMRFGDTLSDDKFSGYQFQFCISNPPFGIDWKREQKAVEAEHKRGDLGRFAPGLPKISDGQQLFVLNGLSKLAPTGKLAIIQNGSPLFSGDAGSGPSEIRRYILENDWLDAIVPSLRISSRIKLRSLRKRRTSPHTAPEKFSLSTPATALNRAARVSAPSATTLPTIADNLSCRPTLTSATTKFMATRTAFTATAKFSTRRTSATTKSPSNARNSMSTAHRFSRPVNPLPTPHAATQRTSP